MGVQGCSSHGLRRLQGALAAADLHLQGAVREPEPSSSSRGREEHKRKQACLTMRGSDLV